MLPRENQLLTDTPLLIQQIAFFVKSLHIVQRLCVGFCAMPHHQAAGVLRVDHDGFWFPGFQFVKIKINHFGFQFPFVNDFKVF